MFTRRRPVPVNVPRWDNGVVGGMVIKLATGRAMVVYIGARRLLADPARPVSTVLA